MRARRPPLGTDPGDFLSHLDFHLPEERIARTPSPQREDARMLLFDRATGARTHAHVRQIETWLRPGDLLVLNRARVDPVRVLWRDPKGRDQEIVLLRPLSEAEGSSCWEAIVSGRKLGLSKAYELPGGRTFRKRKEGTLTEILLDGDVETVRNWLAQHGLPPVPPYIRNERFRHHEEKDLPIDRARYQTTFAREGGAVAAPTAGLHFSIDLLNSLRAKGVEIAELHLAVGWGTFQPVSRDAWEERRLHHEEVTISSDTAAALNKALAQKRRIVAVGTTVVRALEWWHQLGRPEAGLKGACEILLRSPWRPSVVGALLTNFHLPRSSLLALVAAFVGNGGEEKIVQLYREAIDLDYRFFSYGDCMLLL
jgi:S-adenosylmethionine:tRNA ribosyltransferase-isomerase